MPKLFFLILFGFPTILIGQSVEKFTYQNAVSLALKNNFDILIAQENSKISSLENHIGNAGFLPKIDLNTSGNTARNRTNQEFSNGQKVNKSGVISNNINAGIQLSYTIFDGLKMFANKEKLVLLEQQGQLELKKQIEETIENVTLNFYQIVKQQQLINGILATISVSDERIKLAQTKLKIGSGSKVELLQAKLDLNAQKSNIILQQSILQEYKNNLAQLIQEPVSSLSNIDTIFYFEDKNSLESIKEHVEQSNINLLLARQMLLIAKSEQKIIRSQVWPKVGVTSGYNFGISQNTAGFALFNQNLGGNIGLNIVWNIFNGLNLKRQIDISKIQINTNQYRIERDISKLNIEAINAYTKWLSNSQNLELEEENIKLAEQSLFIMLERMKLGLGNYLETKESQSSYEASITRLVNARYNLKESETKLRKISGKLLQ